MKGRYVVLILAAGALAALTCLYLSRLRSGDEPEGDVRRVPSGRSAPDSKDERIVRLSEEQRQRHGIATAVAGPGRLCIELILPGDIAMNADRIAHVVPRVAGVVREVRKNLGDRVCRGEIMAVLESRELADSTAALLAARERLVLARSNFDREEQLWRKKITPEQDYVQARNALAEAEIEVHAAEQKLRALGFADDYFEKLAARPARDAIRYEMAAPFDGTVIEKHISLGELLKDDATAFVVADLTSVWANLDVQQKDLPYVRTGQKTTVSAAQAVPEAEGVVSFLEPTASETNRTIHARVVLPNADGRWRPGMFVTGRILAEEVRAGIVVPSEALFLAEGKTCVFVEASGGFELRPVTAGRTDGRNTEIVAGLAAGEAYAVKGVFTLKAELLKPEGER